MAGHDFQHFNLMLGHVTRKTVRVERLLVRQQVQRSAGRQRTEQQRMPQVGSDRRHHRHARPFIQRQTLKHALHIVGQRAVADHHPLGLPGGAGCVDDVRRLLRQHPNIQRPAIDSGPQRSIERQHRAHAQPRGLVIIGCMHQQHRAAVTGQLLQALERLRAVQRQVHRAQFQHRQQADHPFHGAVQTQRDGHARLDVLGVQVAGELVTACLKLVKVQHLLTHTQRSLATPGTQALLPEAEEIGAGNVLGLLGDRRRYGVWMIGQTPVGVRDQCLQHAAQRFGDTLDALRFEQVGGVGEITAYPFGRVGEVEGQIETRIAAAHRELIDRQARHALPAAIGRQHVLIDLELEQRVVARIALRCQGIHQMLERQFLMRLRARHHLLDLIQQLGKALPLIHLHAQHLSVDEKADQPFQLAAGAPGIGCADADVGLPAEARQHHRQRRQRHHEQGLAIVARQAFQLRGQLLRQVDAHHRTAMARLQRTRMIQWQAQQRMFAAQLLFPVVQLPLALPGLQPGALPDRVICVLNRQLG
ncbi:Uncharacterized protein AC517_3937 [Pseudomonas syringae pv. syringae]|nr:Uncharacterized protein AC517_3937 [Pseudomonas syringae pv. syringae]